jgi:hypothetical protein
MNKLKWILPLFVLAIMLSGCPYGCELPIDKPSVKINPALLGKWEPKSTSDETYTVTKTDEYTYQIDKAGKDPANKATYIAYLSDVDGTTFLNLKDPGNSGEKKFYFYKVELNGSNSKVTLTPVTENIKETFTSSEDLKAFFKRYKSLSFFFSKDPDVFIKD